MKKIKKTLKLDAAMLSRLKELEGSLAVKESKELENSVPAGHPLRNAIEREKQISGDLSGLPEGHPLMQALKMAKRNYEIKAAIEQEEKTQELKVVKKAKKISNDRGQQRIRISQEDDLHEEIRAATRAINKNLSEVILSVRNFWQVLSGYEETLNKTNQGRMRVLRLKRILFATERGLSEIGINRMV